MQRPRGAELRRGTARCEFGWMRIREILRIIGEEILVIRASLYTSVFNGSKLLGANFGLSQIVVV